MIPVINEDLINDFKFKVLPTNTYKLSIDNQMINGYVNGLEAMKQAIYLILNIERFENLIYSWNYGIELQDLFGRDVHFVLPELKRRVTEALLQDSRIKRVENFTFDTSMNKVITRFNVVTDYGNIEVEKVVNI